MPIKLDGSVFYTNQEVAKLIGVSRQSLWRWRQEGLIPLGMQFRGKAVLFTAEEVEAIKGYAFRVEPVSSQKPRQLSFMKLFDGGAR